MTSYLALLWIIIGLVAVLIMLEIQGNPKKREKLKTLILFHRVLGYLFILFFIMAGVSMIIKIAGYQQELSSRPLIHAYLAVSLIPIIALKWLIVRRYKRFFSYLPALGSLILALAFVLSAMTAGYVFLYRSEIRYTTVSEADVYEVQFARDLIFKKCGKCHSLKPTLGSAKDLEGWTKTVNRMAEKDIPNIRPFDIKQIVLSLIERGKGGSASSERNKQTLTGGELIKAKCSTCHDVGRVYDARKDRVSWQKTIEKMSDNAEEIGIMNFLTDKEKGEIIRFLAERK